MISRSQVLAAALGGVLFCGLAGAQARVPAFRAPAGRAPQSVARTAGNGAASSQPPAQGHVTHASPSRRLRSGLAPNSSAFDGTSGVPGLGFDFPHLAAIRAAQGKNISSRPEHNGHRDHGFFLPILFGGGYPYYADDADLDQTQPPADAPAEPQQQVVESQQPGPSQQDANTTASDAGNYSTAAPAAPTEAPISDIGDFVLVRRDGRVLFASLYSVVGTQLQYVTPQGIRHTMPVSDIDSDATQQMNEARGSIVQIHD